MTERIYYTDSYVQEFSAEIVDLRTRDESCEVRLDRTAFYPDSGGQPCDFGGIENTDVRAVYSENEVIWHRTSKRPGEVGQQIAGCIDWERRFDHMQQHSGQHVLSQALWGILGAQTLSFHLGEESSTIDLDVEGLEKDQIYEVEDRANQVVFENRPCRVRFAADDEMAGLQLRSEVAREGPVRLVEIEGFDLCACGGTHVRRTGEIGLIKIRRWERVRGTARVEFYCGHRALRDYRWKNRAVYQISQVFSASERDVVELVLRQQESIKEEKRQTRAVKEELLGILEKSLIGGGQTWGEVQVIRAIPPALESGDLNALATRLLGDSGRPRIILLGSVREKAGVVIARSEGLTEIDLQALVPPVSELIRGGGGGTPARIQAGGSRCEGVEEALEKAEELLRDRILKQH